MSLLYVVGGKRLQGSILVQGSKNMTLPVLCACTLIKEEVVLQNCPDISDVSDTISLLRELGARIRREGNTLICSCRDLNRSDICGEITKRNRMSILLFGCMLARFQESRMEYPGGCDIGKRPLDLHKLVLGALGAKFLEEEMGMYGSTEGLRGSMIRLPQISVGATENALLASCLADGTTVLKGAAREPEIEGLVDFLNLAGARISWRERDELVVEGVSALHGLTYTIASDRIAAGTYLTAAAITGGECELREAPLHSMQAVLRFFAALGCGLVLEKDRIYMRAPMRLQGGLELETAAYPGFPTDMQPFAAALLSRTEGRSRIRETIFEKRFQALYQMQKFGAAMMILPPDIYIEGRECLKGTRAEGTDLRGTAALAVLALAAEGESIITGYSYVERGYVNFAKDLQMLGADIKVSEI